MDDIDRHIVAELLENGRLSLAELGARVSLSSPAVKRRVDRLRSSGVITGFTALVDPGALGQHTEAFVEVHCAANMSPSALRETLAGETEIVAAYTVSGDADALVHVRATDVAHLEATVERIRARPEIARTKTTIVLSPLHVSALRGGEAGVSEGSILSARKGRPRAPPCPTREPAGRWPRRWSASPRFVTLIRPSCARCS